MATPPQHSPAGYARLKWLSVATQLLFPLELLTTISCPGEGAPCAKTTKSIVSQLGCGGMPRYALRFSFAVLFHENIPQWAPVSPSTGVPPYPALASISLSGRCPAPFHGSSNAEKRNASI